MKVFTAFSLAMTVLLAAAPSYAAVFTPSSGSTSKIPRDNAPKPPVISPERGANRGVDQAYRPPIVILPKGKGSEAYDRYVEREIKRDPNGGYQGYRRNRPRQAW